MRSKINAILIQPKYQWLLLALVIFCIYLPATNAMFIDDGSMGLMEIKSKGLKGYLNAYNAQSLYYGQYGLQIILYKCFGTYAIGWLAFFAAVHALNTILLFRVVALLTTIFDSSSRSAALFTALFFYFSPHHIENIAWAATTHYCTTMAFFLWSSRKCMQYIFDFKTPKYAALYFFLFALCLMTLEYSFIFPVFYAGIFAALKVGRRTTMRIFQFFKNILLPCGILIAIYIACLYFTKQSYIPRIGTVDNITLVDPLEMANRYMQVLCKIWGQTHFLEGQQRVKLYEWLASDFHGAWLLLTLVTIIIIFIRFKNRSALPIILLLIFGCFIFYHPTLRIFFSYYFRHEHARHSYYGSIFLFAIAAYLITTMRRYVGLMVTSIWCVLAIYDLSTTIQQRRHTGKLFRSYLNQYPTNNLGTNYVLNPPCFGAESILFMYEGRMADAYYVMNHKYIKDKNVEIMGCVYQSVQDSFQVEKLDAQKFRLQLKTPGAWFLRNGYGGTSYSTDAYDCTLDDFGGFTVSFKKLLPNDKVYYFQKGKFELLDCQ
jgi:hypothetical protein